jgi:hypothetical protein
MASNAQGIPQKYFGNPKSKRRRCEEEYKILSYY